MFSDWGDKENSDLSQRYGVTKEDFPTIKLIVGGKISEPIDFKGKFEQNELKNFIGKHAGEKWGPGLFFQQLVSIHHVLAL